VESFLFDLIYQLVFVACLFQSIFPNKEAKEECITELMQLIQ